MLFSVEYKSKRSHQGFYLGFTQAPLWESGSYFHCFTWRSLDPDAAMIDSVQKSDISFEALQHSSLPLLYFSCYELMLSCSVWRWFINHSMHHSLSGSSNIHLLLNLLGSQVFARYHQMVVMRFVHTADLFSPSAITQLLRCSDEIREQRQTC